MHIALFTTCTQSNKPTPPAPGDPLPALHAEVDGKTPGRIIDASGQEILLRGVNVNSHVEYWQYNPDIPTTFPLTDHDADLMAAMGWNMVRLCISWSRVEPQPGQYDDAYLDEVDASVKKLAARNIYTLMDLHQDAWGPSLAAPGGTVCAEGRPAGGWDGAPAWATFDDGAPRCENNVPRELVPAVRAAWVNFFQNREGPGGVGIRARYVNMFAHVVKRFALQDAVAGYDVMNEPNQLLEENYPALSSLYQEALQAMRQAEKEVGTPKRLFFFEPTIAWQAVGFPAPAPFEHDDQVVYAPHIYQEGIDKGTLEEGFDRAYKESVELYGGAPVVTGEWGGDPDRAKKADDDYFQRHLYRQDSQRFGAMIWTWHTSCGDAHAYPAAREGRTPHVWGFFNQNCEDNSYNGMRDEYLEVIRKIALRQAPGPLDQVLWSKDDTGMAAGGTHAKAGNRLEVFVPVQNASIVKTTSKGLGKVQSVSWFGGTMVYAAALGGPWSVQLSMAPSGAE